MAAGDDGLKWKGQTSDFERSHLVHCRDALVLEAPVFVAHQRFAAGHSEVKSLSTVIAI